MADNSLTGWLALGKQADRTTQATAFYKTLATVSGLGVTFDERQALKEHPSTVAGTSFAVATPTSRTGYLVPWTSTFLLRPRFLPAALQALGFTVTTTANTPETGAHTHVCTVDADADVLWMSAFHNIGGSTATRAGIGARAERLSITASNESISCDLSGTALVETNVSGSPTYTSEVANEILPTIGSITCNLDSGGSISTVRGITAEIANVLKTGSEEKPLFQSSRDSLDRESIDLTGALQGVDFTFNLWKEIIRGSTGGTNPSLVVSTGDLNYTFSSAANFVGATPYSVEVDLPSVQYDFPTDGARNNADDLVRVDISYRIIADVATPITITVINDVASY